MEPMPPTYSRGAGIVTKSDKRVMQQAINALETMTKHFSLMRFGQSTTADVTARGVAHDAIDVLHKAIAQLEQTADKDQVMAELSDAFMQTPPGSVLLAIGNALQYIGSLDVAIAQPEQTTPVIEVDELAQEIRKVDGSHELGAGRLAEALMPFINAHVAPAQPEKTATKLPPLPKVGPICYASASDVMEHKPSPKVGTHLPGVRDVALWSTHQMQAYVREAIAQPEQPAADLRPDPNAYPVPQPVTQADLQHVFETLYDHGNGKYRGAVSKAQREKAIAICEALEQSLAQPEKTTERNFCPRCGKRLGEIDDMHTCTPFVYSTDHK